MLFGDSSELAARMLQTGSVAIIFSSLSTLSNGLLQGMNRMKEPIKNAVIALALHLIILVALMLGLDLNIFAVIIANACFGLIMCILNGARSAVTADTVRKCGARFSCRRFQRLEWAWWYGLFTVCSSICFGAI